jgi:hypothetical protein
MKSSWAHLMDDVGPFGDSVNLDTR